jgi:hypothetical protein
VEFVDRIVVLHEVLAGSDVPHAFGGALALAYHATPRGTVEIDCNIFLPMSEGAAVGDRLAPLGIEAPTTEVGGALPAAGLRHQWDDTHVDLFFSYDPVFFESVERRVEHHAFEDSQGRLIDLPFLSAEDLCIFKITFDRLKDWADIEAMLDQAPLDLAYVEHWLVELRGQRIRAKIRRLSDLSQAVAQRRRASSSDGD